MSLRYVCVVIVLMFAAASSPTLTNAGPLGRAFARGATRSLGRSATRGAERGALRARARSFFRLEHLRDLKTVPKPLSRPRTVYRYVPAPRAKAELHRGIPAGRHLASRRAVGRPLGSLKAQKVYGLPHRPSAVETVRIPAKHPVRTNKVLGGSRGRGEFTSPNRLPPSAIHATHRLH